MSMPYRTLSVNYDRDHFGALRPGYIGSAAKLARRFILAGRQAHHQGLCGAQVSVPGTLSEFHGALL